jgi:hypothetical protein
MNGKLLISSGAAWVPSPGAQQRSSLRVSATRLLQPERLADIPVDGGNSAFHRIEPEFARVQIFDQGP